MDQNQIDFTSYMSSANWLQDAKVQPQDTNIWVNAEGFSCNDCCRYCCCCCCCCCHCCCWWCCYCCCHCCLTHHAATREPAATEADCCCYCYCCRYCCCCYYRAEACCWEVNHTKACTVRSIYSTMLKIGNNVKDRKMTQNH